MVEYPACVASSSDPPPEDCGPAGEGCVLGTLQDAERCRPSELDLPELTELLAAVCVEPAEPSPDMDAGITQDASAMDAAAGPDSASMPDACEVFQMQKGSLDLSQEVIAELEASLCESTDGGAP
jgi:hypothetical protein